MNNEHPMPNPAKAPLSRNIVLGLLIGVFVLVGYAVLPAAKGLESSTQGAPKPALAGGSVMDAARVRLAEENLYEPYAAWLAAAHAHAAVHGQDAPLPSQF